jgi:very-short-patch-repair endonuclease
MLLGRSLDGAKFRQQVVIGRYIVDFACRRPKMLVIEIDGDTHAEREKYDEQRTAELVGRGYQVLRFTNMDVRTNCEAVLTTIAEVLGKPLSPALCPEGEREQDAA